MKDHVGMRPAAVTMRRHRQLAHDRSPESAKFGGHLKGRKGGRMEEGQKDLYERGTRFRTTQMSQDFNFSKTLPYRRPLRVPLREPLRPLREPLRDRRPPFWLSVLNKRAVGSTPPGHVVYVLEEESGAGCGGERIICIFYFTHLFFEVRRRRPSRRDRVRPPV
jgi:hypothetical protein